MSDKLSQGYLFERHTRQQLIGWVVQLRYFYYYRAWGGHANDGDEFKAAINFSNKNDLLEKLNCLGFSPGVIIHSDPQPESGKSYPGTEFARFKIPVSHFPDLEQPGHMVIHDVETFVWITPQTIVFSVSGLADGNRYEVSQVDFEACLQLEKLFDQLSWQPLKNESLSQSAQCVSQNRYPELFT